MLYKIFTLLFIVVLLSPLNMNFDVSAQTAEDGWRLVGFPDVGVFSIVFSPNYENDSTIFIGTFSGIYRSTDKGVNWEQMGTGTEYLGSITFSPDYTNDDTVFAGDSTGFYRSIDKGETWTKIGLVGQNVATIAISPNYVNDHTLFSGGWNSPNSRVYKSVDGGFNWTDTGFDTDLNIIALAISPNYAVDQTIFVGLGIDWQFFIGGVYRSTDGGNTWIETNKGLLYKGVGALAVSPNYAHDNTLFVIVWFGGVFKSTDQGETWIDVNDGQPNDRLSAIAISPNYAEDRIVILGTWGEYINGGVYGSTNGGLYWNWMDIGLTTRFIHRVAISPDYEKDRLIFAGGEQTNGGGLWVYNGPSLSGKVTDSKGKPISGATVSVHPSYTETTDKDGNYTLKSLIPGSYFIEIYKRGFTFLPKSYEVIVPPSQSDFDFVSLKKGKK